MDRQQQSRWWKRFLWLGGILVLLLVMLVLIRIGYAPSWTSLTGFGQHKVKGEVQPAKTLWDWLKLLIVPAVLVVGGYLFTRSENRATQEAEKKRAQAEALQTYLDKISELLIDKQLHKKGREYDETRVTARAHTLAILERLDADGKRTVLLFLREARLINRYARAQGQGHDGVYYAHYVGLRGADLSGANLKNVQLISTSGSEPVSLKEANLKDANLSRSLLSEVDLSGADLSKANLREAQLSGADLDGAILNGAHLEGAIGLTPEQIEWAIGDGKTELPGYLVNYRPPTWSKTLEEQVEIVREHLSG